MISCRFSKDQNKGYFKLTEQASRALMFINLKYHKLRKLKLQTAFTCLRLTTSRTFVKACLSLCCFVFSFEALWQPLSSSGAEGSRVGGHDQVFEQVRRTGGGHTGDVRLLGSTCSLFDSQQMCQSSIKL